MVDTLSYPLGPGDVLLVEVIGEPDMSGELRVAADQCLEIPYAGRVRVGGLTVDQAAVEITRVLGARFLTNPQVALDIVRLASKQVNVSGGLVEPGVYPITSGKTTVSSLVVRAGGLLDPATPHAEIWRDGEAGREVIAVDLEAIFRGEAAADLELMAGDYLSVPPPQQVFVDGKVAKAGGYVYRDGMTITQAIANAGGASGPAKVTAVQLLRGTERRKVNLKRILDGRDPDVVLRPGDQIYVPESVF